MIIESSDGERVVTNYNPSNQILIRQYDSPNPWKLSLRLCQFIKNKHSHPQNKFECDRIRVKLTFDTEEERYKMKKAILVHVNNCSPYIQTYYHLFKSNQDKKLLSIQAKPYQYTLHQIFLICKEEILYLPKDTLAFIRASLAQIYKYVLYLLEKNEGQVRSRLRYDLTPENLAFSDDYRLILINPCISQANQLVSHLSQENQNEVNKSLRQQISYTLKQTRKRMNPQMNEDEDRGLLKFFATQKKQSFKIYDQIRKMYAWSSHEESQIPQTLFKFLKTQLEPKIRFQKMFYKNTESKVLMEYFKARQTKLITDLQMGRLRSSNIASS